MRSTMFDKRKHTSTSTDVPYAKRSRPNNEASDCVSRPKVAPPQPRNDPVYGQKHAFPGLDDVGDDDLMYGPPEDGLEYLRMVRSEARTLPSVFVGQEISSSTVRNYLDTENRTSSAESRHRGIFSDGVYMALPPALQIEPASKVVDGGEEEGEVAQDADEERPDAQEFYYNLLHHQFLLLRSTLKCTPPSSAITALDNDHPISLPQYSPKAAKVWGRLLKTVEPQMVQLACMDIESVLRLMTIVTRSLSAAGRSGDIARVKRLGAWAWGLLGRCKEVGQMNSDEVSEIREFGKRAVKILIKIRSPEMHRALEEAARRGGETIEESDVDDDGQLEQTDTEEVAPSDRQDNGDAAADPNSQNPVDDEIEIALEDRKEGLDDLEAAKARLRERLRLDGEPTNEPNLKNDFIPDDQVSTREKEVRELNLQTRAMLDMIVTIAGEFYGQRDLLEFRDIWEENSQ